MSDREKPAERRPRTVPRGDVEELSDAELEQLAEISPSDIDEAKSAWRQHAPPAFRGLLDARPVRAPYESL